MCLSWAGDRLTLQQQAALVGHFSMESYQPDDGAAPSRRVIALATSCAAAAVIVLTLVALGVQHAPCRRPTANPWLFMLGHICKMMYHLP